jgi:acyl carrier protein
MTDEDINKIIFTELATIAPEADPAALSATANVRETLDIDSYDFLQFLIALSEKLGVEVPEKDYTKFTTLDGMVRYLTGRAR